MTHGNYDDVSHEDNKEEDEREIEKERGWVSLEKGRKRNMHNIVPYEKGFRPEIKAIVCTKVKPASRRTEMELM